MNLKITLLTLFALWATIIMSPQLTLWQGSGHFFLALFLVFAAQGQWHTWLKVLCVYAITFFFAPPLPLVLFLTVFFSGISYVAFQTWIDKDTLWLQCVMLFVIMGGALFFLHIMSIGSIDRSFLGSYILTLPFLLFAYAMVQQQQTRHV